MDLSDRWPLPDSPRGPRRARGGVRRPEPRLPRHPAPDRGPRPARRAGRQRRGVRRHAGAAGRVVPRRGLRRRARRRGALRRLGRGRAGHRGAGAGRVRGGPAGPAHRDAHARRRRRQRLRALRRRPRHPGRAARALRRVRRRGPPRVRPPRGRRVLRGPGRRAPGAGRQAAPVPHGVRAGAVGVGRPRQPRAGARRPRVRLRSDLGVSRSRPQTNPGLRRRSPPPTSRCTSSREVTGSTPRASTSSYHSDGTS